MNIRTFFIGHDGHLRSGWRFLIFCVLFLVVMLFLGSIATLVFKSLPPEPEGFLLSIVSGLLVLFAALFAGWICGRFLENLPFRALGTWFTDGWLRHLVLGCVFGIATLGLAVAIAMALGGLKFVPNSVDAGTLTRSLGISLLLFAVGAAWEEAVFRGYPFQTFTRSGLAPFGIGLTAVIFGVIHTDNPNASTISMINTILAGVWFGIGYLKTRDLWFVWTMHAMWNWGMGALFGIEVSGLTHLVSAPLLKEVDSGPVLLTGETYGIEGGIVTTIAITVSTLVICFFPWLRPAGELERRGELLRHGDAEME